MILSWTRIHFALLYLINKLSTKPWPPKPLFPLHSTRNHINTRKPFNDIFIFHFKNKNQTFHIWIHGEIPHLVPGEHIVLWLLNNWPHQVQPLCNAPSLSDLLCWPFASPPVKCPTFVNHVIHCPHCLFNWRERVRAVTVNHIEITWDHFNKSLVENKLYSIKQ